MLDIIVSALNLWDPYKIYLFPEDEYISEAIKIKEYINNNPNFTVETLGNYVYKILPPLCNDTEMIKDLSKIEYLRFSKLLSLLFVKNQN